MPELQTKTLTANISAVKTIDARITAPREGVPGATFTPEVSEEGIISWTNDRGLLNPESVNIRGPEGPKGDTGEQGIPGPKGDDGEPGKDGLPGPKGDDGFSPIVATESVEGGTKVTITDSSGPKEFTVLNGEPGPKGDDGAPGKDGTVSFDELTPEQKAELKGDPGPEGPQGEPGKEGPAGPAGEQGLPGEPGKDGKPGADGFSPTVETQEVEGGTQVTITDSSGPKEFTVLNGKDGAAGKDGLPGKDGVAGFSPTIETELADGGTKVTITDAQGPHEFTVLNGEKGPKGDRGEVGPQGPDGEQGPKGNEGSPGERGPVGPAGPYFTPSLDNEGNLSWTNTGELENPETVNIKGPQGPVGPEGKTGPVGPEGPCGVYVGTEEPEDRNVLIWIDTDDDTADVTDLMSWGNFISIKE